MRIPPCLGTKDDSTLLELKDQLQLTILRDRKCIDVAFQLEVKYGNYNR